MDFMLKHLQNGTQGESAVAVTASTMADVYTTLAFEM